GLEQQYLSTGIFRKPVGRHATGGTSTDNDHVIFLCHRNSSSGSAHPAAARPTPWRKRLVNSCNIKVAVARSTISPRIPSRPLILMSARYSITVSLAAGSCRSTVMSALTVLLVTESLPSVLTIICSGGL